MLLQNLFQKIEKFVADRKQQVQGVKVMQKIISLGTKRMFLSLQKQVIL